MIGSFLIVAVSCLIHSLFVYSLLYCMKLVFDYNFLNLGNGVQK